MTKTVNEQAALLAYKHPMNQLVPHGYHLYPYTTGLWEHDTRPTKLRWQLGWQLRWQLRWQLVKNLPLMNSRFVNYFDFTDVWAPPTWILGQFLVCFLHSLVE